jgi:N-acetyl-anhydromuramyl-L-alanine amidase AmpD
MSYPFVQSHTDIGRARGPRLAFVIHMAEGGGTVAYLAKDNPNGVSVHYVIERTGRIVQMLLEDHAHTSLRVTQIRATNDLPPPTPPFGRTAVLAVMGNWADLAHGTLGPNHASLAVEIEGFASTGPNAAQAGSLRTLVSDIRTRFPFIGMLGHRDFASYKACPGKLIPWSDIGGHGVVALPEEEPMLGFAIRGTPGGSVRSLTGKLWRLSDGKPQDVATDRAFDVGSAIELDKPIPGFEGKPGDYRTGYLVGGSQPDGVPYIALTKDAAYSAPVPPPPDQRTLDLEYNGALGDAVNATNGLRRVVV